MPMLQAYRREAFAAALKRSEREGWRESGLYALVHRNAGAHSSRLAHVPIGAPMQPHRSAAASLSPPNVIMTGGTGHPS